MALAQYCRNQRYREFFKTKVKEGDTVILDNGAYEQTPVLSQELAQLAREIKPTVVVLPDVPHDMFQTIRRSLNYLDQFGVPKEAMLVLHAKDADASAFISMYKNCPVGWVGFSRLTHRYSVEAGMPNQRADFARLLQFHHLWRPELKHHALGMLNGRVTELPELAALGFEGCDSSAPIWRGLLGYGMADKWPNYAFDPEAGQFAANGIQLAESNLQLVLNACGQEVAV